METKQAYGIGKPKRTKRFLILDEDLCLHQFKSIRDECKSFLNASFVSMIIFLNNFIHTTYFRNFSLYFSSAAGALATLSLKDGVTVERRVDDDSEKKKECVF